MGFMNIDVIDMDTIELSNLNRQFLFRRKDIGSSKAKVAAEFINNRISGCKVTPHFCKIQDFDDSFYRKFHIIVRYDQRHFLFYVIVYIVNIHLV